MAKKRKRVYEVAKDLGISSSELMHKLKFMGIRVANTFNAIDEEVIEEIKRQMGPHLFDDPIPVLPEKKKASPKAKKKEEKDEDKVKKTSAKKETAKKESKKPAKTASPGTKEPVKKKSVPAPPRKKAVPAEEKGKKSGGGGKTEVARKEDMPSSAKRKTSQKARDAGKTKPKPPDGYASPSKRLEAIKQRGLQKDRKGTKTTFVKKRSKKDRQLAKEAAVKKLLETPEVRKKISISGPMTVRELGFEIGLKSSEVIMFLMKDLSLMTTLNQSLDEDVITLVCEYFGCTVEKVPRAKTESDDVVPDTEDDPKNLSERPPVVTVMGHVDHGKTRLLDTIRNTNIIDTESGGITQHIGAYQVEYDNRKITFLDTPGHEAFTQLRARGAKVTDLTVLVVAADDGVMPQTLEAIDHAREANVPILVAVNKIDKSQAAPDRVRQQLSEKDLVPEEWGGKTVYVDISAKFNKNIEDLLEMIFLVTEMLELKANPKRKAIGTIIEAKLDKGKGPVSTVLIQNGTLHVGDQVVVGETHGKVRAMQDYRGERMQVAEPSMPVEIIGLNAVPEAGDRLMVLEDEKTAKEIASARYVKSREKKLRYESRISLEDLFNRIEQERLREFKVVLKADVQGSLEAVTHSLGNITHEKVRVNIIRAGVGDIKETDIMLASASNAVVMGYGVAILPAAETMAQNEKVEVLFYDIIYNLTDQVKRAMAGLLETEYEKVYVGKLEVRTMFSSSRFGNIAGSYVTDGEILANSVIRVMRGEEEIFEGKILSLRRFKDSVKSVKQGFECGVVLDGFDGFKEGDIVEAYRLVEKEREIL